MATTREKAIHLWAARELDVDPETRTESSDAVAAVASLLGFEVYEPLSWDSVAEALGAVRPDAAAALSAPTEEDEVSCPCA